MNEFWTGLLAHILGGLIGALIGWFAHVFLQWWRRRKSHVLFEGDISDFTQTISGVLSADKIRKLMRQFVPLASKARYGEDVPPLREEYIIPQGIDLHCKICEATITPTK